MRGRRRQIKMKFLKYISTTRDFEHFHYDFRGFFEVYKAKLAQN
jgi:hypothetical protein